jgi:hypothetical protein
VHFPGIVSHVVSCSFKVPGYKPESALVSVCMLRRTDQRILWPLIGRFLSGAVAVQHCENAAASGWADDTHMCCVTVVFIDSSGRRFARGFKTRIINNVHGQVFTT